MSDLGLSASYDSISTECPRSIERSQAPCLVARMPFVTVNLLGWDQRRLTGSFCIPDTRAMPGAVLGTRTQSGRQRRFREQPPSFQASSRQDEAVTTSRLRLHSNAMKPESRGDYGFISAELQWPIYKVKI